MPIFTPRVNLSNFQQGGGTTADAISAIGSIFQNNAINVEDANKRKLLDLQIQQLENKAAAGESKAFAEAQQQESIGGSFDNLTELFSPTLEQTLPTGVEGPVMPGVSVEEKLADPASIGVINKAQFNLAKQGRSPSDIANLLRSVSAQAKLKNETLQSFMAGAGGTLGPNEANTVERQNQIRLENQANLVARDAAKKSGGLLGGLPGGDDFGFGGDVLPTIGGSGTIWGNIEKSTGPVSALSSGIAQAAGFIGADIGGDITKSRQEAEIFSTRLISSLRVSPKFPEGERKNLKKIISVEPDIFTPPTIARHRLIAVDDALADVERKSLQDKHDPNITATHRSNASMNLRTIREARRKLGVIRDPKTGRRDDNTFDDIDALRPSTGGDAGEGAPVGMDPEDWKFATPEQRALWLQ